MLYYNNNNNASKSSVHTLTLALRLTPAGLYPRFALKRQSTRHLLSISSSGGSGDGISNQIAAKAHALAHTNIIWLGRDAKRDAKASPQSNNTWMQAVPFTRQRGRERQYKNSTQQLLRIIHLANLISYTQISQLQQLTIARDSSKKPLRYAHSIASQQITQKKQLKIKIEFSCCN